MASRQRLLNRAFETEALSARDGIVHVAVNPTDIQARVVKQLGLLAGDEISIAGFQPDLTDVLTGGSGTYTPPWKPGVDITGEGPGYVPPWKPGPDIKAGGDTGIASDLAIYVAKQGIESRWRAEGGDRSRLGLPVGNKIEFKEIQGGLQADFRSGSIRYLNEKTEIVERPWVRVYWVGLECVIRQEGVDEVYGTVFCHAPSMSATPTVVQIPGGNGTYSMGPQGARMISSGEILYYGPLLNLTIGATLVENDSGDVEEISRNIAEKIREAGAAIIGGLTGVPADAIASETWYQEGIGKACGVILDDVFGIGDDPYLPTVVPLSWRDLGEFPPPQSYQRPGEPVTIPRYTMHFDVSGVDDGKDRGQYRFYFLVESAPWPD